MERDSRRRRETVDVVNFNSHAHVERDMWSIIIGRKNLNFNSHAHVERDGSVQCTMIVLHISTHTLTWSVTSMVTQKKAVRAISTHTLTWSVTKP